MGFSTQVLKPNPLWSACSISPYTIILSPLAYHIYRSSNEQDTNYDCHRTLPPTPNSSQVNMLILCQSLVTYSALSVAFVSYSFHITQPLTCSPFLRPVFLGLWPEPFYLRKVNFCCSHWRWGVKASGSPATYEGGSETHHHFQQGFYISISSLAYPSSDSLNGKWVQACLL